VTAPRASAGREVALWTCWGRDWRAAAIPAIADFVRADRHLADADVEQGD
jgi:hypothetical protein